MIDWIRIKSVCHRRAARHETIRTFQNTFSRNISDRLVEIGFDKRGEICFHKYYIYHIPSCTISRVETLFFQTNKSINGVSQLSVSFRRTIININVNCNTICKLYFCIVKLAWDKERTNYQSVAMMISKKKKTQNGCGQHARAIRG